LTPHYFRIAQIADGSRVRFLFLEIAAPGSRLCRAGVARRRYTLRGKRLHDYDGHDPALIKEFITHGLPHYASKRHKPELTGTADAREADNETYPNELITWRELAVNVVRLNPDYDNFECGEP